MTDTVSSAAKGAAADRPKDATPSVVAQHEAVRNALPFSDVDFSALGRDSCAAAAVIEISPSNASNTARIQPTVPDGVRMRTSVSRLTSLVSRQSRYAGGHALPAFFGA